MEANAILVITLIVVMVIMISWGIGAYSIDRREIEFDTLSEKVDNVDKKVERLEQVVESQNLTVVLNKSMNATIQAENESNTTESTGKISSFKKPLIVDLN